MSRRASIAAKKVHKKPNVRFPDELVFLDHIKENDITAINSMLRRASMQIDINGLNDAGLSPLHAAVLEGNLAAVQLLVKHGADVNTQDTDTWTPLHAACAEGHCEIVRLLLANGARKDLKTCEGERPLDLVDSSDLQTIGAMLESDAARAAKLADNGSDDEDAERSRSRSMSESRRHSRSRSGGGSRSDSKSSGKRRNVRESESDESDE
ncbi:hypothetical protein BaRGS_00004440 [Batillaria attramentaria]|uniref:Uncharacterized protein n=1 Tax=Batillaria attramentaria TaxID=370345 RepID=A0ABD0LYB8_9CAEN